MELLRFLHTKVHSEAKQIDTLHIQYSAYEHVHQQGSIHLISYIDLQEYFPTKKSCSICIRETDCTLAHKTASTFIAKNELQNYQRHRVTTTRATLANVCFRTWSLSGTAEVFNCTCECKIC